MKTVYKFKEGAHLNGDAQAAGERLDALRKKAGGLTPEVVVDDASREGSVLHTYFEWDDSAAARKYRLDQASYLLRSVTVEISEGDAPSTFRAFVPVQKRTGERIYESTAMALSDAEYRKQVLAQAHAELGAVARKWRELKELSEVVQAIDRVGQLLTEGQSS
ncbi:MAG: hypothetical protein V4669_13595 [Pseudomonadota bacterium]